MFDVNEMWGKLEKMNPDEAVALLCEALDSSGVSYGIGDESLHFSDISPFDDDTSMESEMSLSKNPVSIHLFDDIATPMELASIETARV